MDGWIVLIYRIGTEGEIVAAHGILDPNEIPLNNATDTTKQVIPRIEVFTPSPYTPGNCWAFSTEELATEACNFIKNKGVYIAGIERHTNMVLI